jgi:riboflavin synthase
MFTGIVEGLAQVKSISKVKSKKSVAATKLSVNLRNISKGLKVGDSVSINGTCLTVVKLSKGIADFEMVEETVRRTCLSLVRPGDMVNIERSLMVGDRLEGHIVQGHIDGIGIIQEIIRSQTEIKIWIKVSNTELLPSIVPKGSIAIDGVSLTVIDIKNNMVSVTLIPHTLSVTTLGLKSIGDMVNIEIDIIGKYIIKNLPKD